MSPVLQSGNDLHQTSIARFCCQIRRPLSPGKAVLIMSPDRKN